MNVISASQASAAATPVRRLLGMLLAVMMSLMLGLAVSAPPALADDNTGASAANGTVATATDNGSGSTQTVIAGPVPNIIVTGYTYGGNTVAAGATFPLNFTFQNKGKVRVENMVVTVDGGENFTIAGGTNTFYFDRLSAGGSLSQEVQMQAVTGAKSGAQGITVSFRYEYVDQDQRGSNNTDIKLSVPVSQPDRFQVNDPQIPETVNSGEETTVTMEYVNKGKGDIANVEATVDGDGIEAVTKTQYLGNVASGASGSIGFAFTPTTTGEVNAKFTVTYEDSDGHPQTKEFPVTLNVQEPPTPVESDAAADATVQEQQGVPWWAYAIVAVAVVLLIVVIVVVRRRRKRKKKASVDEAWDDWEKGADSTSATGESTAGAGAGTAAADGAATTVITPNDDTMDMPAVASVSDMPGTGLSGTSAHDAPNGARRRGR
ncbi:ABC transporter permease [Bifidobacterium callimiconis]|uniref:COG1361 S-layer family protein n=1 Tax=Bifidobacterium callimiconis TaxID=2306973 RepID=UPI001BDBEDEB|nr:CARDB domain-containing protein [Bifidobacterium callimiconis]MBT1178079.1 ABC transporter permease [Bifidobacterium callimiconis]